MSIWDDISNTPEEAADLSARAVLVRKIGDRICAQRWSDEEAAARLSIDATRVPALVQGRVSQFSLDELKDAAGRIGGLGVRY